ncbi:hypothetical protein IJH33_02065 [Candidatus Saccharibacteria bacterium]|nr:hypothetical protein [Candidatus Saccharibacteria bacterium]
MIDLHAHILPGVDDGARDFEDAVAIVSELVQAGVTEVVATPHFVEGTGYTSTSAENQELLQRLSERLEAAGVNIKLHLGNEIYINREIAELVKTGVVAPLAGSEYLLVELPMSGDYQGYEDVFAKLLSDGYKVVLAHPERYESLQNDYGLISELVEMGVLLQCNLGSFVGQYGKRAKRLAVRLAKEKRIFAFGSDIHHVGSKERLVGAQGKLKKYYDEAELLQVLTLNPGKIVNGLVNTFWNFESCQKTESVI